MAGGGRCAPRLLAPLVAALVVAGCALQGDDPTLRSTGFVETACRAAPPPTSASCCGPKTGGTQRGQGRCDVVAVDERGADLVTGASYGPLALAPGRSYEWLVELQQVDDPAFDRWVPECHAERG